MTTIDLPPHASEAAESDEPRSGRREIQIFPMDDDRLRAAKRAFTTRNVPANAMRCLVAGPVRPRPGNLVLARIDRLGQHKKLELTTGRRATLHLGDEIVVAFANRYAPDQFESHVPLELGPTQLVASGGVASEVLSRSRDVRAATDITALALIGDERGRPLDLADFALPPAPPPRRRPRTVAVLGASMNSGKTTTIHQMVRGLVRAGHRPGVTKVTGTGSGGDYWVMQDAGAHAVLDFTDAGMASTYLADMASVEQTMIRLTDHLIDAGCGSVLIEVADGALQRETAKLIETDSFKERVDGVVFAAPDALSAIGGVSHLRGIGLPVVAVAGRITRSPLAVREAAMAIDVPILTLEELADPAQASGLFGLPLPRLAVPSAASEVYEAPAEETADEIIDLTEPAPARERSRSPLSGRMGFRLDGRTV